ncbi:MAG: phospholipid carrier-dependent glycosyltransferase [Actinomycetota bacterium]
MIEEGRAEEGSAAAPSPTGSTKVPWTRLDLIVLIGITLIAAVLRLWGLADPPDLVFDETYYAKDACNYAGGSKELCEIASESTRVHPPLGKWLIAVGVKAFAYDSFGWRIVPAIAGTITVVLLFLLARRLFRSLLPAAVAALLLAIDPLHFVQSRTAMLDIFVPMFGLAAFLFLVMDRDRMIERANLPPDQDSMSLRRPWRLAAGAAAAAAVASKWSGILIFVAIVVLTIVWEVSSRRRADIDKPGRRTLKVEGASVALFLFLVPLLVYTSTYIGRIHDEPIYDFVKEEDCAWKDGNWTYNFFHQQLCMLGFHRTLEATHSYQSPAWSWPLIKRPVSYFFCSGESCNPNASNGEYQEIFATGSPFVWWTSLIAMASLAVAWALKRDFRQPEGLILAGFAFTYLPWLIPTGRSAVFIFYLLPTVPFMCLAIAWAFTKLGQTWEAKASVALYLAGAIGLFVFYYPLLTKGSLPEPSWRKRIWVFDNCDKPQGIATKTTVTTTRNGREIIETQDTTSDESLPPKGWCWI